MKNLFIDGGRMFFDGTYPLSLMETVYLAIAILVIVGIIYVKNLGKWFKDLFPKQ